MSMKPRVYRSSVGPESPAPNAITPNFSFIYTKALQTQLSYTYL